MYEIVAGKKKGTTRGTQRGARMTVVNCPDYEASTYAEADEYIREVSSDVASEVDESGDGENPAFSSPEPEPRAVETNDEPTCPHCGGTDYFDASEHTDYAYGCPDCSSASSWVVWGESR